MEHQTDSEARPYVSGLSKFNAFLARYAMYLGVIGLLAIVAIVVYQAVSYTHLLYDRAYALSDLVLITLDDEMALRGATSADQALALSLIHI